MRFPGIWGRYFYNSNFKKIYSRRKLEGACAGPAPLDPRLAFAIFCDERVGFGAYFISLPFSVVNRIISYEYWKGGRCLGGFCVCALCAANLYFVNAVFMFLLGYACYYLKSNSASERSERADWKILKPQEKDALCGVFFQLFIQNYLYLIKVSTNRIT